MTTSNYNTTENLRLSDYKPNNQRIISKILSSLPQENIFVPLEEGKKHSCQSGWNQKRNLIYPDKAKTHIQEGGNVGLILGKWFNGSTFVLFDCEETGILPEDLKAVIDSHTLNSFISPHDGLNRIVRIDDKEAYELLDSFKTTISDIREGGEADLELITNGASPIPPSEYNHTHCKECNQEGKDRYTTVSINPEAPPLGLESVERIGKLLDLEGSTEQEPDYNKEINGNIPSPRPSFNIQKEYMKNIPSVNHSFRERKDFMMNRNRKGGNEFVKLWNGDFEDVSGSQKQGRAECKIASDIGFYFGNNEKFVRLFMDMLPFESHYKKYESHREYVLHVGTNQTHCYCDNVRIQKKYTVAERIYVDDRLTVKQLSNKTAISESHINRIIPILEAENIINIRKESQTRRIQNNGITKGYLVWLGNYDENMSENIKESIERRNKDNANRRTYNVLYN
jgi:hypothetical protein